MEIRITIFSQMEADNNHYLRLKIAKGITQKNGGIKIMPHINLHHLCLQHVTSFIEGSLIFTTTKKQV